MKDRLGFCKLTQDGDEEGGFILGRLPTESEAAAIRYVLGIPNARHLSEDQRLKLVAAGAQSRFPAEKPAKPDADGPDMPAEAATGEI